jgi:hypothetical protein
MDTNLHVARTLLSDGKIRPLIVRLEPGHSRWREWDDPDASDDDVQEALSLDDGRICDGLDAALDASGFDWWVETRTLGSEEAA